MGNICSSSPSSTVHPSHLPATNTNNTKPQTDPHSNNNPNNSNKTDDAALTSSSSSSPSVANTQNIPSTATNGTRPSRSKGDSNVTDGPSRSAPTAKISGDHGGVDTLRLSNAGHDDPAITPNSNQNSPLPSAKTNNISPNLPSNKLSNPTSMQKSFTFNSVNNNNNLDRASTFNNDNNSGGSGQPNSIMKKAGSKGNRKVGGVGVAGEGAENGGRRTNSGGGGADGSLPPIERLQSDVSGMMSGKSKTPLGSPRGGKEGGRRRKSEENPTKGVIIGESKDNTTTPPAKKKEKHKRKVSSGMGMMSKLALQFPQIRKSFMAVYSVFERYMMTRNRVQRRGSTVEYKDLGNITMEKLGPVIEAITNEYGHRQFGEAEIRELFNLADLDGSKTISFREFLIAVAIGYFLKYDFPEDTRFTEIQRGFKHVANAFKEMDDDGSNSVDAEELKHALFSASDGANNAILEARFKELDFNDDGDVSLPEFMYCMVSWVGFVEDSEDGPDEEIKKEARETPRMEMGRITEENEKDKEKESNGKGKDDDEGENNNKGKSSSNRSSPRTPILNLTSASSSNPGSGQSSPRAKSARSSGEKPIGILKGSGSPAASPQVTRQKSSGNGNGNAVQEM